MDNRVLLNVSIISLEFSSLNGQYAANQKTQVTRDHERFLSSLLGLSL